MDPRWLIKKDEWSEDTAYALRFFEELRLLFTVDELTRHFPIILEYYLRNDIQRRSIRQLCAQSRLITTLKPSSIISRSPPKECSFSKVISRLIWSWIGQFCSGPSNEPPALNQSRTTIVQSAVQAFLRLAPKDQHEAVAAYLTRSLKQPAAKKGRKRG